MIEMEREGTSLLRSDTHHASYTSLSNRDACAPLVSVLTASQENIKFSKILLSLRVDAAF